MTEQSFLKFEDLMSYATGQRKSGEWLTVYARTASEKEDVGNYSALVPIDSVDTCLNEASWDLSLGDGMPGFVFYSDDRTEYLRFGDDDGIEPLIIYRSSYGSKPAYVEVSEEFRHFHDLHEDRTANVFVAYDESGDEIEVVRMSDEKVEVKVKYIKEYLSARGMAMLLYYVVDRWSAKSLAELGMTKEDDRQRSEHYCYSRFAEPYASELDSQKKTIARLLGKKVFRGAANYDPRRSFARGDRKYEEFIIAVDDDGEVVHHTSDEDELSNYFGKNPGAPHYLTPVFFRKGVMAKYYNAPARYSVDDGYLSCTGYWGLQLDNNHADYVVVFLGDLGKLPNKEQLYWKSHNVSPDGKMSDVAFRRAMLGEWAEAAEPALVFKRAYEQFGKIWLSKQGWDLFKPLKPGDVHHWTALHVPSDGNQKEFDEQIMSLTKLLVDRINEAEVGKRATLEPDDKGGITKFGRYLGAIVFPDDEAFVKFLRNLQSLRSGAAHVKDLKRNSQYQKAVRFFDLDTKGLSRGFADILSDATVFIEKLEEHVTTNTDDQPAS
ncbi:hypothetical protein ABZ341_38330 [Streptomyces sp. NPDC006173]|uniref:hypothetical protein n=1 Tax=Streptomyces sp. NPDC006173 TaxID=3155349 RepID=UPI0033E1BD83